MIWESTVINTKKAWKTFKQFGEKIAAVVNFVFLLPVYFIGGGITALIMVISKKGFYEKQEKSNKEIDSYWQQYNCTTEEKQQYFRMF